jgi:hypothetical protein
VTALAGLRKFVSAGSPLILLAAILAFALKSFNPGGTQAVLGLAAVGVAVVGTALLFARIPDTQFPNTDLERIT